MRSAPAESQAQERVRMAAKPASAITAYGSSPHGKPRAVTVTVCSTAEPMALLDVQAMRNDLMPIGGRRESGKGSRKGQGSDRERDSESISYSINAVSPRKGGRPPHLSNSGKQRGQETELGGGQTESLEGSSFLASARRGMTRSSSFTDCSEARLTQENPASDAFPGQETVETQARMPGQASAATLASERSVQAKETQRDAHSRAPVIMERTRYNPSDGHRDSEDDSEGEFECLTEAPALSKARSKVSWKATLVL